MFLMILCFLLLEGVDLYRNCCCQSYAKTLQNSSPPNNSDGIFPASFFVQFSIASRSLLDRFSIGSRSVLDRSSIDSRSSSVHSPFILRSGIEDRSKIDRRMNGESSEAKRRCIETLMGNQGKGDPNIFLLNFNLL